MKQSDRRWVVLLLLFMGQWPRYTVNVVRRIDVTLNDVTGSHVSLLSSLDAAVKLRLIPNVFA